MHPALTMLREHRCLVLAGLPAAMKEGGHAALRQQRPCAGLSPVLTSFVGGRYLTRAVFEAETKEVSFPPHHARVVADGFTQHHELRPV